MKMRGAPMDGLYDDQGLTPAMQLTANKPAIDASGGCRRASLLRGMHSGLAAAGLVSR